MKIGSAKNSHEMTSGQSFVCSHSCGSERYRRTDGRDGLDKQRDEEKLNCTCHILLIPREGETEMGQNRIEQSRCSMLCICAPNLAGGKLHACMHDLECVFFL